MGKKTVMVVSRESAANDQETSVGKLLLDDVKITRTVEGREIEKRGLGPHDLSPSFWRTIRALKNVHRLGLLKCVYETEETVGVTALARRIGLKEPTVSVYLRMLNARGLISVSRNEKYVYYATAPDRSLPFAVALQDGFRQFFSRSVDKGWRTELMKILKGISHYNRVNIIRYLAVSRMSSRDELFTATGICEKNFEQHLRKLVTAGLVRRDRKQKMFYSIPPQGHLLARILLDAVTSDLHLTDKVWLRD